MSTNYDKYYKTENLFGQAYPELIEFFASHPNKGSVLDLGCGQGRDAIALARLGYQVTGLDHSKVGIDQLNQIATAEGLPLVGKVANIFEFDHLDSFDFVLLDSMFHFAQKDLKKETDFIKKIIAEVKDSCLIVFCVPNTGNKIDILNQTIDFDKKRKRIIEKEIEYVFEDKESGHSSKTNYLMIVIEK